MAVDNVGSYSPDRRPKHAPAQMTPEQQRAQSEALAVPEPAPPEEIEGKVVPPEDLLDRRPAEAKAPDSEAEDAERANEAREAEDGEAADEAEIEERLQAGRDIVDGWDDETRGEVEFAGKAIMDACVTALCALFTAGTYTLAYEASAPESFGKTLGRVLDKPVAALVRGNLFEWTAGQTVEFCATVAGMPPVLADLVGRTATALLTHRNKAQVDEVEYLMDAALVVNIGLYANHGNLTDSPALWFLAQAKSTKTVTAQLKDYADRLTGAQSPTAPPPTAGGGKSLR